MFADAVSVWEHVFSARHRFGLTLAALFSGRFGPHSFEGPVRLDAQRHFGPELYFYGKKDIYGVLMRCRLIVNNN